MCGIAGVVAVDSGDDSYTQEVIAMTDAIAHRGPDGEGVTEPIASSSGATVILGHRRLSIVDIAGGVQPMQDSTAGLHLTFNGEIYNHNGLRKELESLGHTFNTLSLIHI